MQTGIYFFTPKITNVRYPYGLHIGHLSQASHATSTTYLQILMRLMYFIPRLHIKCFQLI